MSVKRYVINCVGQFFELGHTPLSSLIGSDTVVVLASDYERDVQALRDENANLQTRLTGMTFDRNCRQEERDALGAENLRMREALEEISRQIDGDIRPTVRDCVNGMPDVQDIYDYCDAIEQAIDEALSSGKEVDGAKH